MTNDTHPTTCLCDTCIAVSAEAERIAFELADAGMPICPNSDYAHPHSHGLCPYCQENPLKCDEDGEPFSWCDECDEITFA